MELNTRYGMIGGLNMASKTIEDEARELFMERLNLTDGHLVVGIDAELTLNKAVVFDFDVRLRDGSVHKLKDVPCVPCRVATPDEHKASVRGYWDLQLTKYGESVPSELREFGELPYHYLLSFD